MEQTIFTMGLAFTEATGEIMMVHCDLLTPQATATAQASCVGHFVARMNLVMSGTV